MTYRFFRFFWGRESPFGDVRGTSEATIDWEISPATPSGYYRISHYGHYKNLWNQRVYPYHGHSQAFYVRNQTVL